MFTAEAFSTEVIDPELTPSLYRLATKGIQFKDYYQPAWGGSTSTGEFTNITGLVPANGIDSIKEGVTGIFFDEQTPESLIQAMTEFEALPPETFADRSKFATHVEQFSQAAFTAKIQRLVDERKRR